MNKTQQEKSYVYLLFFKNKHIFKIGKADNISSRYYQLKKYWGEIDAENSYFIETDSKNVHQLEKFLQFYCNGYVQPQEFGDGKTEFFSEDALPDILDLFNKNNPFAQSYVLTKGVHLPTLPENNIVKTGKNNPDKIIRKKANKFYENLFLTNKKLYQLNRVIALLYRKQNIIPFFWIEDDKYYSITIYFLNKDESQRKKISDYFFKNSNFYIANGGINVGSSVTYFEKEKKMIFEFRKIDGNTKSIDDTIGIIESLYIRSGIERHFRQLPQQSDAYFRLCLNN